MSDLITVPRKNDGDQLTAAEFDQLLDALEFGKKAINTVEAQTRDGVQFSNSHRLSSSGNTIGVKHLIQGKRRRLATMDYELAGKPPVIINRGRTGYGIVEATDTDVLTNPSYTRTVRARDTGDPEDGQYYDSARVKLTADSAKTNITVIFKLQNVEVARSLIARATPVQGQANTYDWTYDFPVDMKVGDQLGIEISSTDGDVKMYGDRNTNIIWHSANIITWDYEPIALDKDVEKSINDIKVNGNTLTMTHNDGAKHVITIPTAGGTPFQLDAGKIYDAVDMGVVPSDGSISSISGLTPGWWYVEGTNRNVGGRPSNTKGDLIINKVKVQGPANTRGPGVMFCFGLNDHDTPTVWIRYRTQNWSNWIQLVDIESISAVVRQAADNHDNINGIVTRLSSVENNLQAVAAASNKAVGSAQNAISAAQNANSLGTANQQAIHKIQTDLGDTAEFKKKVDRLEAQVVANNNQFASISKRAGDNLASINSIKQDIARQASAIEKYLTGKGWGPLPKGPGKQGGGDEHVVVLPRIYAVFGANFPTSTTAQGMVTSTTGKVTLTRIATDRKRIFVLVENDNDEANKVTGISVDGGMAAQWQPRDLTISGKKYRAFYSAGAYSEAKAVVQVHFG